MIQSIIKICVAICLFSEIAYAQLSLPNSKNISDSLRNEGEIINAIEECRRVYQINPKDQRNLYNFACFFSISRQIDSCFRYLELYTKIDTSITPLIEPDLITARESEKWKDFESNLISMINIKFGNPIKDIEYAKTLLKLRALDQSYFLETGIAGRKLGFKSSVVEALWSLKNMIQVKNQNELERLIDEKGWPRKSEVGIDAAFAAWLVIMHSNSRLQNKYLPAIKKICQENELSWVRYASIYDRCQFNDNKLQRYGTQTRYNEVTKTLELYPLEDETMVDVWRKEVGLQPLEEYLKQNNIPFKSKTNNK